MVSKPDITHEDIVKRLESLEESIKKHITAEKDIAEILTVALERATSDSARNVWIGHYDKTFKMLFAQVSNAIEKAGREVKSPNTPEIIKAFHDAFDGHISKIGTAMSSNFNNNRTIIDKIGVSVKIEIEAIKSSLLKDGKNIAVKAVNRIDALIRNETVTISGGLKKIMPKPKSSLFRRIFKEKKKRDEGE